MTYNILNSPIAPKIEPNETRKKGVSIIICQSIPKNIRIAKEIKEVKNAL
jgi:hypothetical protein